MTANNFPYHPVYSSGSPAARTLLTFAWLVSRNVPVRKVSTTSSRSK